MLTFSSVESVLSLSRCFCEQKMAARKTGVCPDHVTLASEIADGDGKCMPAIAKTRLENTGRPSCGPERSWPPDRVTSRMTMAMAPVDADALQARLVIHAPKQVPPNPTELRLVPAQRKRQASSGQPRVEPLVSLNVYLSTLLNFFLNVLHHVSWINT